MHDFYRSPTTPFGCLLKVLKTIFCLQYILQSFVYYSTFMTNTPDEIIRSFCGKWADGDVEEILNYFDEKAIYHNIPMAPANGIDEIRLFIEGFFSSAESIDFEILHQVASGNTVMNERIDTLVIGDATTKLPVAGIFKVLDGKIIEWRDYFDMGQFTASMA